MRALLIANVKPLNVESGVSISCTKRANVTANATVDASTN